MIGLIIIYGLILIVILFAIANLSDKVERLERQLRKQEQDIANSLFFIKQIVDGGIKIKE